MKDNTLRLLKSYVPPQIHAHEIILEDGITALSIVYTTDENEKIYEQRDVDVDIDGSYNW